MLPSMLSPVESEICPPDVCFPSGDAHAPPVWANCAVSDLSASDLDEGIEEECKDHHEDLVKTSRMENSTSPSELEGAVGGGLPDLCHTGCDDPVLSPVKPWLQDASLDQLYQFEKNKDEVEFEECSPMSNAKDLCPDTCSGTGSPPEASKDYESEHENSLPDDTINSSSSNDFLVHSCKHISLVACGAGEVNLDTSNNDALCDNSTCGHKESLLCEEYGALVVVSDLQNCGFDLVRQNLVYSSHPSFYKWQCSAFIPTPHLSSLSLQSHGSFLGSEPLPLNFASPSDRSVSDGVPQLTEEEQMKLAKRFGLIQHLPCGIFDGMTKSRECVICMIDFSVGDKVRYLPCMHTYHTECIDDWLMRSFTCPSCLEPVDAALLNSYETS